MFVVGTTRSTQRGLKHQFRIRVAAGQSLSFSNPTCTAHNAQGLQGTAHPTTTVLEYGYFQTVRVRRLSLRCLLLVVGQTKSIDSAKDAIHREADPHAPESRGNFIIFIDMIFLRPTECVHVVGFKLDASVIT